MEKKDEYAIVLDFMPRGHPLSRKREPLVQAIGFNTFSLLDLTPKQGQTVRIGEKVYIGSGERDKIEKIVRRINYKELSNVARKELTNAIERIIEEDEKRFVDFFNNAESINIREHQLDLLPGIGKKSLWDFLEERKKKKFESLKEINERVASFPDAKKMLVKRILEELEKEQKVHLFTRRPYERRRMRDRKFNRRRF